MPHRDTPAPSAYGPRIYAAKDHTLEIYEPDRLRGPSPLLVFGVTALAAALVLTARRAQPRAPLRFSGATARSARPQNLLANADATLHTLGDALSQAQVILAGISRAATEIRGAVSDASGPRAG